MRKGVFITVAAAAIVLVGGIVWYLALHPADTGADPSNPDLVRVGKQIYLAECASCHGRNLEGQPNWRRRLPDGTLPAPPHDETGHTWHHSDKVLFEITKYGRLRGMRTQFKSTMPGFGDKLDDRDINAVLAFIKSRWPEQVRQRQALINARNQ